MDRTDIAREPSRPTHYALIFASGRTGFEYHSGTPFDGCEEAAKLMVPPEDGFGRLPGVAFRLANQQLVIARPGGRAVRLARAL